MKTLLFVALCTGCLCLLANGHRKVFDNMIKKVTGKNAIRYSVYGCHCGSSGGNEPLDATDWCCWTHDCCYANVRAQDCDPKKDEYSFKMDNDNVACEGGRCGMLACECDKAVALCFKANKETYQWQYTFYPNVMCKKKQLECSPANSTTSTAQPSTKRVQ